MATWKVIKEFPNYSISDEGQVRNNSRQKIKSFDTASNGYYRISLYKNGKRTTLAVHRLVATYFLDPPNDDLIAWSKTTKHGVVLVNHKDGNKSNNHVDNLEWCDGSYNVCHARSLGLCK